MFGQQNNKSDQDNTQIPEQSIDGVLTPGPSAATDNQSPSAPDWQHPGAPLGGMPVTPSQDDSSSSSPQVSPPSGTFTPTPDPVTPSSHDDTNPNDLIDIKQQALSQLSPLVGHLDQSPEEKFRTTMMMIQASDDQSLIKAAYQAAQSIEDEKTRAQALLDIVNEINYFTQQPAEDQEQ